MEKILKAGVTDVVKLHGDASYRAYYRAFLDNGETRIVMQMPSGKSSASEEITNFKGVHKELPFINIQRFLSSLNLPVPSIYKYDDKNRLMILEDLGDGMFAKYVKDAKQPQPKADAPLAQAQEKWYKKAIDLLADVQRRTSLCAEKEKCVAMQRSFDATLLNWEFDHFREYLIEARFGKPMESSDRKLFENATRKITAEIVKMPYTFTHRDFQSRNLIVRSDNSLAMIDFQDALKGPYIYDLVALLRDSYVELDWGLVEKLIEYYCCHCEESAGGGQVACNDIIAHFHLVTLQRKMKDAGRFVYIDRVKKNPNFLQYIPTSLRYIKNAFEHANVLTPRQSSGQAYGLANVLKKYVPEFK
ncbi:MAG: phosphotransferase [Deltaproteobacteria bacterium]|nr:phosphotransferase [Deltaproteobacteria bacterium]